MGTSGQGPQGIIHRERQRETGLFSLAHRMRGPSETCLQLYQDGSCKHSADTLSPGRQDKEEQWPQKAPWHIQVGHNDNLFHYKGGEEQAQVSHGGHGFAVLWGFHSFRGQNHDLSHQCHSIPALNEWLDQRPPEASSDRYTCNSIVSLIPVIRFQQLQPCLYNCPQT